MGLAVDLSHAEGPLLVATGDLDVSSAPELRELGFAVVDAAEAATPVSVDLAGVTFMDSTALGALVELRAYAVDEGKKVVLLSVPAPVRRIMTMTGLDAVFTFEPLA